VLGVGINVALAPDDFPPELRDRAGTLGRRPDELDAVLAELLAHLAVRLAQPVPAVLDALRARDALQGRPLRWAGGTGTGAGIDDAGALRVRRPDGGVTTLEAGEVHLGTGAAV
jgi:BirA family biotin operon repressor/biotin-[acetyl-CoA-carboxylase] ligase